MDARYGPRRHTGLRARKARAAPSKTKMPRSAAHHALNSLFGHELGGMPGLSDLELSGAYKLFMPAVIKEMKQLHERKVIRPRACKDLTLDEMRRAIGYLMFIKEKRTMSMGKGAIYSTSTCQKLNTKSSTEAELVGVDDMMPVVLWTRQFPVCGPWS